MDVRPIVLQLPTELVVTLECFHAEQRLPSGQETIALRTLEEHAKGGRLPGAFKIGGIWFVNKLAMAQHGYDSKQDGGDEPEESPREEKENSAPPKARNGKRGKGRREVAGAPTAGKRERLRYPS